MISSLERLVRLLDEYEPIMEDPDAGSSAEAEDRYREREKIERRLLKAPVRSDADAVAKMRHLARAIGDGERSDGLDILAMRDMADWMDRRFVGHAEERQSAAA